MSDSRKEDIAENEADKPSVGYRRPPVETRFKPGVSGNPKGKRKSEPRMKRPVSKRKFLETILEETNRTVSVLEGGKQKTMPAVRAMIRSFINVAMKDHRSFKQVMNLIMAAEATQPNHVMYDFNKLNDDELATMQALLGKCQPDNT